MNKQLYLNLLRDMLAREQERIRRAQMAEHSRMSLVQWNENLATFTTAELERLYRMESPR